MRHDPNVIARIPLLAFNSMKRFLIILRKLAAEFRAQALGHRALHEIRFAKYKVAAHGDERAIQEFVLRRLPRRLESATPRTLAGS